MIHRIRIRLFVVLCLLIVSTLFTSAANPPGEPGKDAVAWGFLQNQGQWADDGLYRAPASGFHAKFQEDGVSFMSAREVEEEEEEHGEEEEHEEVYEHYVWKMRFEGGNPHPEIEALEVVAARTNFFIGDDPAGWRTNVPEYRTLVYHEVWKGIDVRFRLSVGGALKYEFLLAPGADPDDIRIEFEGLDGLEVLENGQLRLDHPWEPVVEDVPVAFTENGEREVPVRFQRKGKYGYGFELPEGAPRSEAWIIDPLFMYWGSFADVLLPGTNYTYDVSYDLSGHLYIGGRTNSSFPATTGAFQTAHGGATLDAYVAKFTPDGSNLAFMTYLGGTSDEDVLSLGVGSNGRVYVCGTSASVNFPVTPGAIFSNAGNNGTNTSPWSACLNSTGSALIYSTFLCQSCYGQAQGLVPVSNDEVIVAGMFNAVTGTFPTTTGAFMTTGQGLQDGFVCRLNAAGNGMVWSTVLGGSGMDDIQDVAVNDLEEPYVVGSATGANFPVTPGAFQASPAGRSFVTRLNANGSALVYSSWFASSGELHAVDVHPVSREAFIAGYVDNGSFVATPGAFQTVYAGSEDAVVARVNASGSALIYATYLGGVNYDRAIGIAVRDNHEVYVSGYTVSFDFPVSSCQFQTTTPLGHDGFIAHLAPLGDMPARSGIALFGGQSADYWNPRVELRQDGVDDTLFCCLTTHSMNFPVTPGAFETVKLNGTSDTPAAFKLVPASPHLPDTVLCGQDSLEVRIPPVVQNVLWSTNATTSSIWITQSGQYWVTGTLFNCPYTDTFQVALGNLSVNLGADTSVCDTSAIALPLDAGAGTSWLWSTAATTSSIVVSQPGTYWVEATDTNSGCTGADTIVVTQGLPPSVNLPGPLGLCAGDSVVLDADPANQYPGASYLWSNAATTQQSTFNGPGWIWVDLTTAAGCSSRDSSLLTVHPLPVLNIGADTLLCDANLFHCDAGPGFAAYLWSNGATTQTTDFTQSGTVWVEVTDANGCHNRDSLQLTIAAQPGPDLGPDRSICSGNSLSFHADPNSQYPGAGFLWQNGATTPQITSGAPGWVWVQVTTVAGCVYRDSVLVTVHPLPPVDLGPDRVICDQSVLNLDAGPGHAAYLWSDNSSGQTATFSQPGIIWVAVTDANGCTNRDSLVLAMGLRPQPDLGSDTSVCGGASIALDPGTGSGLNYLWSTGSGASSITVNQAGTYSVVVTEPGSGCAGADTVVIGLGMASVPQLPPDTLVCDRGEFELDPGSFAAYQWSDGSSGAVLTATESGMYAVTVTDGNGCESEARSLVSFGTRPTPDLGEDLEICGEDRHLLSVPRKPGDRIRWSTGSNGHSLMVTEGGEYWVEISNECGRRADTIRVVFQSEKSGPFVPNAFYPNSEIPGNEVFRAVGEQPEDFRLRVYDRWGRLVFESLDINEGWDATLEGKPVQEGVYVFVMSLRACDGKPVTRRGTVVLIR